MRFVVYRARHHDFNPGTQPCPEATMGQLSFHEDGMLTSGVCWFIELDTLDDLMVWIKREKQRHDVRGVFFESWWRSDEDIPALVIVDNNTEYAALD